MSTEAWELAGDVLENCSCDAVCPGHFSFRNRCTHEECRALWAFESSRGHHGETDLGGLRAVLVAATPQYMIEGNWKVALYLDERATEAQANALEAIYTGGAGGPWGLLDRFIGHRFPTRRTEIRLERRASGRLGRVEIPEILISEVEPVRGHDRGSEALLVNVFNTLYQPRHVIARGTFEYRDFDFDWQRQQRPSHGILTTYHWMVEAD